MCSTPRSCATTTVVPATRTCTALPSATNHGVPNPSRLNRSPILPFTRWRAGASARSATACSPRRVRSSASTSSIGTSSRHAPSHRSAHQAVSIALSAARSSHVTSTSASRTALTTCTSRATGACTGSSANQWSSTTAGGDGSSTRTSNPPPSRVRASSRGSITSSSIRTPSPEEAPRCNPRVARLGVGQRGDATMPSVADTYITAEMEAIVGAELTSQTSLPISASDIRRWAIAVYYPSAPPRHYWDEEYAATTRYGGIVAPEEFNPFAWITAAGPRQRVAAAAEPRRARPGSVETGFGVEPPPTKFMLNGGVEVTYGARMRPGDVITSVGRHGGYSERTGRLGRMLFTYSESEWTNQRGEWVKTVRGTLIRY